MDHQFITNNIVARFVGVRKPPVPFGVNGRSVSGSVVPSTSAPMTAHDRRTLRVQIGSDPADMRTATLSVSTPEERTFGRAGDGPLMTTARREYYLYVAWHLWS